MTDDEEPGGAPDLAQIAARVQEYWDRTDLARSLLAGRADGPVFRFTEGPPTANGQPHLGHVVGRALKDAILRYRRMRGDRIVTPMAGWDCHGLPVELEIEKKHGLRSKKQIEEYGVARFCAECRAGALEVASVWTEMSRRMGYWLDYEHPYQTMDASYIESVWWALSRLHALGLLEKGHYCLPYCPRCETSLSSHEVAQGYRETTDPSVTVRLRLHSPEGSTPRYLLVWTTTPWTLPSNLLVAARAELAYVVVRDASGSELVLAEAALPRYFAAAPPEIVARLTGRELSDRGYEPPFDFAGPGPRRYRVVLDDSVDPKEGTGFVHIAPSFGPEDQRIGEREGVGFFDPLDGRGVFTDRVPPVAGKSFKAADPILLEMLAASGTLYRRETLRHTYPFCWRCETALMYRALDSWFVRTSRFADRMVRHNEGVRWVPEHLRAGRFGNFLSEAKDWALSRSRYWGTPLPVWRCAQGHTTCVGSFAELSRLAAGPLPDPFDPHRVTVDALRLTCPTCAGAMEREPYTIDAWFDSGSAPFAQYHYPFEPGPFDPSEPLDAVAEGLDQTRGWFYTMLVIATALFDRPAYRACVTNGLVLDDQGRKMSKSKGNAIEPLGLLARHGGDAVRWAFYVGDYTEPMRLSESIVRQASQRTLGTLANVLAFYRGNALPDAEREGPVPDPLPLLDRWILARTARTVERATAALEALDHRAGALEIAGLVGDLSTWYLRRSRPRLWVEAVTADRRAAAGTLARVLGTLAKLLAPYAPFLAEAIHQEVSGRPYGRAEASVHALPWPEPDPYDPSLLEAMEDLRGWVEATRELRARTGVKSRIPLPTLVLELPMDAPARALGPEGGELLRAELNVRELRWAEPGSPGRYPESDWVAREGPGERRIYLSRAPTPELFREGLVREALRRLQTARKEMRLRYTDRIRVEVWTDEPLLSALREASDRLAEELLTDAPVVSSSPAPAGDDVRRWEFEGVTLAARVHRAG
jgi:isoleucyl-tRNA synthetase